MLHLVQFYHPSRILSNPLVSFAESLPVLVYWAYHFQACEHAECTEIMVVSGLHPKLDVLSPIPALALIKAFWILNR